MSQQRLIHILTQTGGAIAVSGGIDSTLLACIANRHTQGYEIFHAISPAVTAAATERVKRYAKNENWRLHLIDAGEFHDPDYRANPVNRCFYCKKNLYSAIRDRTSLPMFSGTNLDDLDDYRPGLRAAQAHQVRHPFVEAEIDKRTIRHMARELGLSDLAELPAAPCLSSRVETGIRIDATDLRVVEKIESFLAQRLGAVTLRCRIRRQGVCIEVDASVLAAMSEPDIDHLTQKIRHMLEHPYRLVSIEPYVQGSAFVGAKG